MIYPKKKLRLINTKYVSNITLKTVKAPVLGINFRKIIQMTLPLLSKLSKEILRQA